MQAGSSRLISGCGASGSAGAVSLQEYVVRPTANGPVGVGSVLWSANYYFASLK